MYKSNADEEEIIKCFHCGNETIMKKLVNIAGDQET